MTHFLVNWLRVLGTIESYGDFLVNNLRLHGVRRDMGLLENALRACEDRFCRLRYRLDPAGLLGFDTRLLFCFLLRVGGAAEFGQ